MMTARPNNEEGMAVQVEFEFVLVVDACAE